MHQVVVFVVAVVSEEECGESWEEFRPRFCDGCVKGRLRCSSQIHVSVSGCGR